MNQDSPTLTLSQRLKGLMLFRVLLVTLFLGGAILANAEVLSDLSNPRNSLHFGMIISTYVLTIIYALLLKRRVHLLPLAYAQIGLDLVLSAALVLTTGGLHTSIFLFTLFLPIIAAALLTGRRSAIASAALVSGYIVYLTLLALGITPGPHAPGRDLMLIRPRTLVIEASVNITFAFLLAWSAGQLAKQLGEARSEIARRQLDLRELRALNENIFSSLNSGLLTVDMERRVIFFNRAAAIITGLAPDEVLGHPLSELLPIPGEALLKLDDAGPEQPPGREARLEGRYTHPNGRELYLGFSISALRDAQRNQSGHIVIFQDLSEIKALEEQAQRSERMAAVGQLSAAIAHEIRNPLASISGSVELLKSLATLSEDEDALMSIILREVERLNVLISDFLDYSRPRPLRLEPTDLAALVRESMQLFRNRSSAITLTIHIADGMRALLLDVDREAMKQILWNLLNNSADAMDVPSRTGEFEIPLMSSDLPLSTPLPSPSDLADATPGARIDVGLELDEAHERLILSVEDNGPGIPEDVAAHLFEPFFTTKAKGTGLGLAAIYRLIEDHGGTISHTPPRRLQGARFEVTLPLERARGDRSTSANMA